MTEPKLCECGCGQPTPLATRTNRARGKRKGEPLRFAYGHSVRRLKRWVEEDRGYDTPCWIWQLARSGARGYGNAWTGNGTAPAHRLVYEELVGAIPDGLDLDHLCRVRACVNPAHLEPVTRGENLRRGSRAKLVAADVVQIRAAAVAGEIYREIAARFGISRHYVWQIVAGRAWADLLDDDRRAA